MKAMVLCAGYGTRLGELTRDWPKPMLPLDARGRPLLAFLLGHLRAQGFTDVALNVHFRPEILRDWFGDGSRWGLRLHWSLENQLLGTAGGVKNLAHYFRHEDAFLVQYGDILTDQDLAPLVQLHQRHRALATLLVHPRARSNSIITLDPDGSGRITGFLERPTDADRQGVDSPWVNSGICVCSPEILDHIPAGRPADFPRDVFRPLVATGRLHALPLAGWRRAIDSPERLDEARRAVAEGRCRVVPLEHDDPPLGPQP
jgi:NDP-sugar pyrophosphorylase family protein